MPGKYLKDKAPITQFKNCKILRDHKFIKEDLWIRSGKIVNPLKLFFEELAYADVQVDCAGSLIAPGFIDIQINGGFGVDFSSSDEKIASEVKKVAKALLPHGVTSFCPTIITLPAVEYKKILPKIRRSKGSKDGAAILGVHLEGPFINREKHGAHPVKHIHPLTGGMQSIEDMYGSLENVNIITLAPEIPGAMDVINDLVCRGIIVSLGHSAANLSQGENAIKCGAKLITHLFNAMLPFHHRDPHLIGLLASKVNTTHHTVYYSMIADGVHTHPAALRLARQTNRAGLILVTDAIPAMGLPTGTHHMGVQTVEIRDGKAYIAGTDTLCGSIASLNECVQYFYTSTDCSAIDALEAASLHPAELLGISERKGSLGFGLDADFIVINEQLSVQATYIAGECVWKSLDIKHLIYVKVG